MTLILPKKLEGKLRELSEERGLSIEETLIETLLKHLEISLDPNEKAEIYYSLSKKYLGEAEEFLLKGDTVQASEKLWGAAALMVKTVAARKGEKIEKHGAIWRFMESLTRETGDEELLKLLHVANSLHRNFYENEMTLKAVKVAAGEVKTLLRKLETIKS